MKFSLRHQSTGIAYRYLSQITPLMLLGFFRKIYKNNVKGVPSDAPVILAGNHPSAFVDPVLLCLSIDPPLYNMTRGDIFAKPFYRKLLESINMFPVYRTRDGFTDRDRNDPVIAYCVGKLAENRVVGIFIEGEHHLDKRVRAPKKGFAHIAFAAYARNQQPDLQVIPAGCCYYWGDRPRDTAFLNIGSPIYVRDFWNDYVENPARGVLLLTRTVEAALKKLCYHIDDPQDDAWVEQLLEMHRSDQPDMALPIIHYNTNRFEGEKAVCDFVNRLDKERKMELRIKTEAYFSSLEQNGLQDLGLMTPHRGGWLHLIWFLLGFIPFIIGFISSWPIIGLARWGTDRLVKKREFKSSIWMGIGFFTGVIYYGLLFLVGILTCHPFWMGLTLSLPFLGWFYMFYRDMWVGWRASRKALDSTERNAILLQRADLKAAFGQGDLSDVGGVIG
ncbi:MAG: 1-acyl-sn-glycerol-3-phosphate acyltransferase [Bacteroidetes bacterium]|nr:1-acyl-sn-glycerol-3-phosphate acyltransferase [Bacteroidota bacterium]